MRTNMHESVTPSYARPTAPFRYPSRTNAPEGFKALSQSYNPSDIHAPQTQKKFTEFAIDTLPNGKFRATLRKGNISSTISFNASAEDLVYIQHELTEYMRDEFPSLEACTIFLMLHLSHEDIQRTLTGTSEVSETSKYAKQGRSAMYIHEAYEGSQEGRQNQKTGRPRQDAHKLKVDVRPGSDIPTLIHAGFTRFDEIRATKTPILP